MDNQNIFSDGWGLLPRRIAKDDTITDFSKVLYSEIAALCAEKGYCWAKNEYFEAEFKASKTKISRAIAEIKKYLYITDGESGQRKIQVHQLGNLGDYKKEEVKKTGKGKDVPTKKKVEKKIIVKFTTDDLFLAELLLSKVIYNFPLFQNKKVQIKDWAEDIRKLREIDKATFEQIKFMIMWVHGGDIETEGKPPRHFEPNDFWSKNILSASKLRKQWFEHLIPQLQEKLKKSRTVQL